jgi:hypothetical protein
VRVAALPDNTKQVLEDAIRTLYKKAASQNRDSYLLGGDNVFLGRITDNPYDQDSITNEYGQYGNPFSATSIFNEFSIYGNPFSQFSVNNPWATSPPWLYLLGTQRGRVSKNEAFLDRIDTDAFINALRHDINGLLAGKLPEAFFSDFAVGTYIQANDGTYLGSLDKRKYDQNSVFNTYGPFGSKYSQTSIFNRYGPYGSKYSALSPFNQYSATPPVLIVNGQPYAYLSKNRFLVGRVVDPDELEVWVGRNR